MSKYLDLSIYTYKYLFGSSTGSVRPAAPTAP